MRVKWTGESAKWMMFAVIDESPHRFCVNGADDLHWNLGAAIGLTITSYLSRHQSKHSNCLNHVAVSRDFDWRFSYADRF